MPEATKELRDDDRPAFVVAASSFASIARHARMRSMPRRENVSMTSWPFEWPMRK